MPGGVLSSCVVRTLAVAPHVMPTCCRAKFVTCSLHGVQRIAFRDFEFGHAFSKSVDQTSCPDAGTFGVKLFNLKSRQRRYWLKGLDREGGICSANDGLPGRTPPNFTRNGLPNRLDLAYLVFVETQEGPLSTCSQQRQAAPLRNQLPE